MKKIVTLILFVSAVAQAEAQQALSLDSCRAMALRNNKQLGIARLKQDMARNTRKAARTKYLPHVSVLGGYEFMSREISLLNDKQKSVLSSLGTTAAGQVGGVMQNVLTDMVSQGAMSAEMAQTISQMAEKLTPGLQQAGNKIGQSLRDGLRTDTRNIFTASVMLTQPIYMGGAIIAANKIADIGEQMAANDILNRRQNTIYDIDNAYWMVVSLKHKQKLAGSYLELVRKLDDDVKKMIREGVATRADGLKVNVKVNEAEMQLTQVDNGVSLAKMLLCQLCGMPVSDNITLIDETKDGVDITTDAPVADVEAAKENRAELKMLQNAVDISRQTVKIIRAAYLPQIGLTAGYLVTNPNLYNGYERKFAGVWNVGVIVRVPVWNWNEGTYKVRAAKTASSIAQLELEEAGEKIELQVNQSSYKLAEANKKLNMATKNTESADENLRCANLGFKEGVMDVTDVMAAQTAWLQARSQKIDAEIDVKMSLTNMRKVLGDIIY